jgi:hypothetical protein
MKPSSRERARERKAQILSLWQKRPSGKRTEKDVVIFYGEMERSLPHLLSRQHGDAYQSLMRDLKGYVEQNKKPPHRAG